jgi:glycosyltransferase involved in cell wall biosynthesis
MGALRWQRLVQFAHARGWCTDVILCDPRDAEFRDDSRLADLPPGVRLFAVPLRGYRDSRLERLLRRVLVWTSRATSGAGTDSNGSVDTNGSSSGNSTMRLVQAARRSQLARRFYRAWIDWAENASALGKRLAASTPYDVVVSSGPPHMAHEAARKTSALLGIPFVADFRDPWAAVSYEPSDFRGGATWRRYALKYERLTMQSATLVVMNTPHAHQMIAATYPHVAPRLLTVMNGADDDMGFSSEWDDAFTITYAGNVYGGRDPRILFRGVRRAVDELRIAPGALVLRFMGSKSYGEDPLRQIVKEEKLDDYFLSEPRQPRSAAIALMRRSAMVVVLPQPHEQSIPGKLYEYVQLRAWVLVLTTPGTATDVLLRGSSADVVDPADVDGISRIIVNRYTQFRQGIRPTPVNADGRFDRSRQARILFDALERVLLERRTRNSPRDERAIKAASFL